MAPKPIALPPFRVYIRIGRAGPEVFQCARARKKCEFPRVMTEHWSPTVIFFNVAELFKNGKRRRRRINVNKRTVIRQINDFLPRDCRGVSAKATPGIHPQRAPAHSTESEGSATRTASSAHAAAIAHFTYRR